MPEGAGVCCPRLQAPRTDDLALVSSSSPQRFHGRQAVLNTSQALPWSFLSSVTSVLLLPHFPAEAHATQSGRSLAKVTRLLGGGSELEPSESAPESMLLSKMLWALILTGKMPSGP